MVTVSYHSVEAGSITVWSLAGGVEYRPETERCPETMLPGRIRDCHGEQVAILRILICILLHISTACSEGFGDSSVTEKGMIEVWQTSI